MEFGVMLRDYRTKGVLVDPSLKKMFRLLTRVLKVVYALRRVLSICLLGVQEAVEGKGRCVLAIDNYAYYSIF